MTSSGLIYNVKFAGHWLAGPGTCQPATLKGFALTLGVIPVTRKPNRTKAPTATTTKPLQNRKLGRVLRKLHNADHHGRQVQAL